jgi:thiamine-monophosphate kinase
MMPPHLFMTEPDRLTLITTDLLVERIHFLRNSISGFDLGYKSLAVNLSDIAAMGGTAREAFVSIAIPDECHLDYLDELYNGIKKLAARFDVNVLGGDTTRSTVDLIINIVVQGTVLKEELLCRDAAQPGDVIFAHLVPEPHLREGRFLARRSGVNAAIDTSDGLSSDLAHIVEESRVGARLFTDKIPISPNLKDFCTRLDFKPLEFALAGGEDYTLLCTISPHRAAEIGEAFQKKFKRPLFPIGKIIDKKKIEIVYPDGKTEPITPTGWDHFRAKKDE